MTIFCPQHHTSIFRRFIGQLGPAALSAWDGSWGRYLSQRLAETCVGVASDVAPDPSVIDLDYAAPGHPDRHGRQHYLGSDALVYNVDGCEKHSEALIWGARAGGMTEYQARELLRKRAGVRITFAPYGRDCRDATLAKLLATFQVACLEKPAELLLLIAWNDDAHPDTTTNRANVITGVEMQGSHHQVIPPP